MIYSDPSGRSGNRCRRLEDQGRALKTGPLDQSESTQERRIGRGPAARATVTSVCTVNGNALEAIRVDEDANPKIDRNVVSN